MTTTTSSATIARFHVTDDLAGILAALERGRRGLGRRANPRGGGYLGMVRMQDPVDLLARDEL